MEYTRDKDKNRNLYYLEELGDYKVKDGDTDCRGWDVKDSSGRKVGEVDNFLVNKNTEKVVYLDIEIDDDIIDKNYEPYAGSAKDGVHGFVNEDGENHVILPVGMAHLDHDDECVHANNIDYDTFAETKRIRKGDEINRDYEILVLETYDRNKDRSEYKTGEAFYDSNCFIVEHQH
ncbi:MAG: photosystem reaction center subunit H [Flavobacteriaceae bacterium]|nr:photosystem reaction center subunit H [Flavobacteriaceae bacterium]